MIVNSAMFYAGILMVVMALQNYASFIFTGRMLGDIRLSKAVIAVICIINSIAFTVVIFYTGNISSLHYLGFLLVITIEFSIAFKNDFIGICTCSTAIILHVLALRAIIVSVFCLYFKLQIQQTTNDQKLFWISTILTFAIHSVVLFIVMKIIPSKYLKIINQNKEFSFYLCLMCITFVVYMIFNGSVYGLVPVIQSSPLNQILLSTAFLSAIYIALSMMIKMVNLYEYKEKNEALEKIITKDSVYKSALVERMDIVLRINCTENRITHFLRKGEEQSVEKLPIYDKYIRDFINAVVHDEDKDDLLNLATKDNFIRSYYKGLKEIVSEYRAKSNSGNYIWYQSHVSLMQNENGDIIATSTITDIETEKAKELHLKEKADRDTLTNALNRSAAKKQITKHILENRHGALFVIDLDNFKAINDNFGHAYGDEVLKGVYEELSKIFREKDLVARFGGDEFIVFLKDSSDMKIIKEKAQNICDSVKSEHLTKNNEKIEVTVSVGVALYPFNAQDYTQLFKAADEAMYISKNSGKNRYNIYSDKLFLQ